MQYKGILSTIYDKFSESRSFRTNFYLPLSRVIGWLLEWQILPMSDLINGVQVFCAHFEQLLIIGQQSCAFVGCD
ncbi:MAG: hypothetical protein KZQ75_10050, partial [Candidatus Thiodiazotropha sp. (ex Myrtea spinifera)]|nr:hypothetical protein [Candidatus Thiodiazotropha sp. (ex Myrtea spinifera)]